MNIQAPKCRKQTQVYKNAKDKINFHAHIQYNHTLFDLA